MCNQEKYQGKDAKIKDVIRKNAITYERYKDNLDQVPQREIDLFRKEVEEAYYRIQRLSTIQQRDNEGRQVNQQMFIRVVDFDPYDNLLTMSMDVKDEDRLYISSRNNDSKLLPGELNLKFRAVHDFLHYYLQQPFTFQGEFNVYKAQKFMHKTKIGRQLLYSEIVLQAAYCEYYGKFADKQKVIVFDLPKPQQP